MNTNAHPGESIGDWLKGWGMNQAPGKALGSSKARRCEFIFYDGVECEELVSWASNQRVCGGRFEFDGMGLWVCGEHWRLLKQLSQLRGDGLVRQMIGCSETGKQVWERNYFYALGRLKGQEDGTGELYGWHDG